MKSSLKTPLVLFAAFVLVAGTVGCQSGFKMRNPFAKEPKASSANPPGELDELDDLTPPPENYSISDSKENAKDTESIVQKGKYGVEESTSKFAPQEEASVAVDSAPAESSREQDRQATFATNAAPTEAAPADASPASSSGTQTYATFDGARANARPDDPYMTPYVEPNAAFAQNAAPASAPFPAAQNDFPTAQNNFPTAQNDFPTAQGFAPGSVASNQSGDFPVASNPYLVDYDAQSPASTGRVESVAMNYDSNSAQSRISPPSNSYPVDSDPYSGVVYEPQTTSTGFAPGSTAIY